MKINDKILRLVKHGLKATNLTKLNESQINTLYSRLVEQSTKMIPKSNSAAIQQAKTNKEVFSLYEKENTDSEEVNEKSVSKKQHGLMGAAYSVEKGDKKLKDIPKSYRGKVEKVVDSMSKKQIKDFAKTKTKNLPDEVNENNPYDLGKAMMSAYSKGATNAASKIVPNVSYGESVLEKEITRLVERHLSPKMTKKDFMNIIENNVISPKDSYEMNEEFDDEMGLPSWLRWENITKK
jgi:predicted DNA-binding transcriptional regulator